MAYFTEDGKAGSSAFSFLQAPATPPNESEVQPDRPYTDSQIPSLSALLARHAINRTISPPTPAASPQPYSGPDESFPSGGTSWTFSAAQPQPKQMSFDADRFIDVTAQQYPLLNPAQRRKFINTLLPLLSGSDLLQVSNVIAPLLKRDFLSDLPTEVGLHVLSFIEDPRDLVRAARVSKTWRSLVLDEQTWKLMCEKHRFGSGTVAHAVRASASLPGFMSLRESRPRALPPSRTGFTLHNANPPRTEPILVAQPPVIPASAALSAARSVGDDTPAIAAAQNASEMWAMQGLGILRQTPRSNPLASLGITALAEAPRTSTDGFQARPASVAPVLPPPPNAYAQYRQPSLESPVPRRPVQPRQLSVEMPSAPRLGHASFDATVEGDEDEEDAPPSPTAGRSAPALPQLYNTLQQLDPHRPAGIEAVMADANMLSAMVAPAPGPTPALPLPRATPIAHHVAVPRLMGGLMASAQIQQQHLGQQPQTTITLSPRAPEPAPTDNIRHNFEDYAFLSSVHDGLDGLSGPLSPGDYSSNPFGIAKLRPASRSASANASASTDGTQASKDHFSYQSEFKRAYLTESNWLRGPGRVLSTQAAADDGVVTSLGFDTEYIVVGMATKELHVFHAETGDYARSLVGHAMGIWALSLISKGGTSMADSKGKAKEMAQSAAMSASGSEGPSLHTHTKSPSSPMPRLQRRPSSFGSARDFQHHRFAKTHTPEQKAFNVQQANMCGNVSGWGQSHALVVSAGCDRTARLWDVETGECLHVFEGHTSTVRCLKVVDGRPIAVTGSRDSTVRVWDLITGQARHVMLGHLEPVRCLEISGMKVVSGSYDNTARLWDIETGQCLFTFSGHYYQIYAVAFDGQRVVTGSLDSTVRIWSARTGDCLALLQGHTSLVGQLQLTDSVLVTGGSDGRVIVFSLATLECLHRICAHDNSVTCLQFDDRFIVTGGNDGRVKLFDFKTGQFIRELAEPCEAVWRVTFREDKCVILCKRLGRTTMSVITFRPDDAEL